MSEIKKSNRGGKREGAGRKRKLGGIPALPVTEDVLKTINDWRNSGKKLPLEIMLEAMETTYEEDGALAAVPIANLCTPYFHARLSTADPLAGINMRMMELDLQKKEIELQMQQIELKRLQAENNQASDKEIVVSIKRVGNE